MVEFGTALINNQIRIANAPSYHLGASKQGVVLIYLFSGVMHGQGDMEIASMANKSAAKSHLW